MALGLMPQDVLTRLPVLEFRDVPEFHGESPVSSGDVQVPVTDVVIDHLLNKLPSPRTLCHALLSREPRLRKKPFLSLPTFHH